MILRLVRGRLPAGSAAEALVDLREPLARAALDVPGLDSLIVGTRQAPSDVPGASNVAGASNAAGIPDAAGTSVEAVLVTIWRDVDAMVRATAVDEQDRFLGTRLDLPLEVDVAVHYEIAGRAFAALPPPSLAYLRVLRIRSRPHEEAGLIHLLRERQRRLVSVGLISSHVGRRVVGADIEAVVVTVWPGVEVIRAATGGRLDGPLFDGDTIATSGALEIEAFDAIEVTPRLPAPSGPPLFVLDGEMRIVDATATAAATLGWEPADLVGRLVSEIASTPADEPDAAWLATSEGGTLAGEAAWRVPLMGDVHVRFVARRDTPVEGRHAVLVHRWNEPPPTTDDLDAAVRDAFPDRAPGGAAPPDPGPPAA